jgi:hypothetical protein
MDALHAARSWADAWARAWRTHDPELVGSLYPDVASFTPTAKTIGSDGSVSDGGERKMRSARSTCSMIVWWFTQIMPIVMKLTAYAAYDG